MLNFDSIRTTAMQKVPYNWALIKNLLSPEASLELAASFPHEEFRFSEGEGYGYLWTKMFVSSEDISLMLRYSDSRWQQRIAEGRFTSNLLPLSNIWRQLIEELWTDSYRAAIAEMSGLELKDCAMGIGFRRYNFGHLHRPHTDEPNKVLTHLLFFNQQWSVDWGGCLRILKDSQPESAFQDILPVSDSSVAIARSDNSWHTVTPLTCPASESRLALRVAFFRNNLTSDFRETQLAA
ncbi:2OG-Fe(II) oxygenase [Nostoc cf. edaphicum LEGE 07299]|uniref:2OG-Fe(II) oxygenase n=1 Tax=Nostoc cf. edaphicum LEGE 07299 TaxID=2777974 RepID=A0ABR9TV32_9NOSO|nr:2OG-Fe(II) oxygenase [Nostoc edaphicum]MBE9103682.1 2OG-Fe(II) oxygenase [Nostoc cf. edaphicum LEGE 07299]